MPYQEIRQFHKIKLKTTRNIKFLSAPPNTMPSPHGIWSVVGNMGKLLLVCKDGACCAVPVTDVILSGRGKVDHLLEVINGKEKEDNHSDEIRDAGTDDGSDR